MTLRHRLQTGSRGFMRKLLLEVAASLVATLIVSVGLSHVFPNGVGGASSGTPAAAQWAGNLATATAEPATASEPVTSASYLVKADAAFATAPKPVSRACAGEAACPPYKAAKVALPPRRPAAEAPQPAPQVAAALPDSAPAPSTKTGFFHAMNVADHLPSTDRLLKPFTLVSDTVSHWVKRF